MLVFNPLNSFLHVMSMSFCLLLSNDIYSLLGRFQVFCESPWKSHFPSLFKVTTWQNGWSDHKKMLGFKEKDLRPQLESSNIFYQYLLLRYGAASDTMLPVHILPQTEHPVDYVRLPVSKAELFMARSSTTVMPDIPLGKRHGPRTRRCRILRGNGMWWPIGNEYEAFESNFHPFETQSQSKRHSKMAHK